jgi:hypothetical protein
MSTLRTLNIRIGRLRTRLCRKYRGILIQRDYNSLVQGLPHAGAT